MAVPIVYRYSDAGAPAKPNTSSASVVELLKTCLVDGYGSKPGAGWTVKFSDANYYVLQNSVGNFGLRLNRSTGAMDIADDWSNTTTPVGAIWNGPAAANLNYQPYASYITYFDWSWILIATPKNFAYFCVGNAYADLSRNSTQDQYAKIMFCGPINSVVQGVSGDTAVLMAGNTAIASALNSMYNCFVTPSNDGVETSNFGLVGVTNKNFSLIPESARPNIPMVGRQIRSGGRYGAPLPPASALHLVPIWAANFGYMRGVYGVAHQCSGQGLSYDFGTVTMDGDDFIPIRISNYTNSVGNDTGFTLYLFVYLGDWDA